jgi:pilus assembly protein Flp/PilA
VDLNLLPSNLGRLSRERGVTSIEYALLASLIAMVVLGGMLVLGVSVKNLYDFIASKLPPFPGP